MIPGFSAHEKTSRTRSNDLYGYCYFNFVNPCPAKLNNLNFQPLAVVSRYRDPQLLNG